MKRGQRSDTGVPDVASRDADGYLTYIGRTDDVFKASDYRISPFELESVLIEHPAVAEAAVVPAPDPVRLAVPKAYVVLAAGWAPRLFGLNTAYTELNLVYHAVFSVTIPIVLVELLFAGHEKRGTTMVLVTHDSGLAARCSTSMRRSRTAAAPF